MKAADAPTAHRIITLALAATKAKTMMDIYERIRPGSDGRIRSVVSPVGTETGRFSHSESFLEASTNLGNMPKKTAMLNPLYNVRRALRAADGHVLIEADLSQAEARVTSAYACDDETLAVFDSGADIHKWTAGRIFGVDPDAVTKQQRHLGKMARHALNYGMGWKLFLERINKDADLTGIAISAAEAKRIVEEYHSSSPKLLAWWKAVWEEAQRRGYLVNPYGRRRDFLSPYVRPTDVYAYLPQSTIADHLNEGLVEAYAADLPIALQIHDAVLLEVPSASAASAAQLLHDCLSFPVQIGGYSLTIPVDVSVGERWSEMEAVEMEKAPLQRAA